MHADPAPGPAACPVACPAACPPARLTWTDDGIPVAEAFADPYYSKADGAAEAAHVFLGGNGLPGRFHDGFHIAELGFGTGLNLLVVWAAWRAARVPGRLRYTSFEAFPMAAADRLRALSRWPDLGPLAADLADALASVATGTIQLGPVDLTLVMGDARQTLPAWGGQADAWFLDGFSPARNPELWGPELMAEVARHTAPGGSFATYSAAGGVRRALDAAGFDVTRQRGFGHKRHMSIGGLR